MNKLSSKGQYIRLIVDPGKPEPGLVEQSDSAWKHNLEKLKSFDLDLETELMKESFEYYMRRGNFYYFRGVAARYRIYIEDHECMKDLRYHDTVFLKYEEKDKIL